MKQVTVSIYNKSESFYASLRVSSVPYVVKETRKDGTIVIRTRFICDTQVVTVIVMYSKERVEACDYFVSRITHGFFLLNKKDEAYESVSIVIDDNVLVAPILLEYS